MRCTQNVNMSDQDSARLSAPAATEKPCLLSLPDDAIVLVFANFDGSAKLATFAPPCDATNLAAAHPRFDRLRRFAVVKTLQIHADWRNKEEEGSVAAGVRRLLRRYPRVEKLEIDFQSLRGDKAAPIRLEAFVSAQLRVVQVQHARLSWRNVDGLLRACPALEDLGLTRCPWARKQKKAKEKLDDAEVDAWSRLQVLRLKESSKIWRRLASNPTLLKRLTLRQLDLSNCWELRRAEFDACAMLSTMTQLSLKQSAFSTADAARILPLLSSLRELDVSGCKAISSALLAALPPTLIVLRASNTNLFEDADGNRVTTFCGGAECNLSELHVDNSGLRTWQALSRGFGKLRWLSVAHSVYLVDERVEEALAAMPQLEKLRLTHCLEIGDRTMTAISRHPNLSCVWVHLTATGCPMLDRQDVRISEAGFAELSRAFRHCEVDGSWVRRS